MSYDIYGNPLQRGHCEAHPHVHEEYPCSVCIQENNNRNAHKQSESDHYEIMRLEHELELSQQRIEELEAQVPKWVSVEDELPGNKQSVLVVVNGYGRHIDKYYKDKGFREFDGFVTHWMPLPQPPKENDNE